MILFMFVLSNIELKEKSYYNWYWFFIMLVNIKLYLFIFGVLFLLVNLEILNDLRLRFLDIFRKRRMLFFKVVNCINFLCSFWWFLVMYIIISCIFVLININDCWFYNSREKIYCEILIMLLFKFIEVVELKIL